MKLDSVRTVKASMFAAMAMAAGAPVDFMDGVSLGIGKKDCQNVLAVRIPVGYGHSSILTETLQKFVKSSEMDVQVVDMPNALPDVAALSEDDLDWRQRRNRPLRVGASLGHYAITAGTTGCFGRVGNDVVILSNNHVMANCDDCKDGDAVLQPGKHDGGTMEDRVANLRKWVQLKSRGLIFKKTNRVDAAVADVISGIDYDPTTLPMGKMGKVFKGEVTVGMEVVKFGRTTGVTHGRVTTIEMDNVRVNYGARGVLVFDNQIEIEGAGDDPYSSGGDSGSVVLENGTNAPLGLLFAGGTRGGRNNRGLTIVNYMSEVLLALEGLELLS
jgi:hypothetical protein